jgi:hypothetical protein
MYMYHHSQQPLSCCCRVAGHTRLAAGDALVLWQLRDAAAGSTALKRPAVVVAEEVACGGIYAAFRERGEAVWAAVLERPASTAGVQ